MGVGWRREPGFRTDAKKNLCRAVFEYIPYRRRDITRPRDEPIHRYFAGNGLASLRVDMRGSGDSDGLMRDEYEEQEQLDAVEVIAWLARQPWCAGNVWECSESPGLESTRFRSPLAGRPN